MSPPSNPIFPDAQPFRGYVANTLDALRLVLAARQGIIPRITRRLNDIERRSLIKSGAVFVFDVKESGIKRWTEGLLWSPSRIVGNFLVYREIDESGSGGKILQQKPLSPPLLKAGIDSGSNAAETVSAGYIGFSRDDIPVRERAPLKRHGLTKKTITVTMDDSDLHLIAYYMQEDLESGLLQGPSGRPDIMAFDVLPRLFRLSNFRNPPPIETGPDGQLIFSDGLEKFDFDQPQPSGQVPDLSRAHPTHDTSGAALRLPALKQPTLDSQRAGTCFPSGEQGIIQSYHTSPSYHLTQHFTPVPPQISSAQHHQASANRLGRFGDMIQPSYMPGPSQSHSREFSSATSELVAYRSHLQHNYPSPTSVPAMHPTRPDNESERPDLGLQDFHDHRRQQLYRISSPHESPSEGYAWGYVGSLGPTSSAAAEQTFKAPMMGFPSEYPEETLQPQYPRDGFSSDNNPIFRPSGTF